MKNVEDDRCRLKAIKAPTVVAVPPGNPHRSLCRMPNGEIRFYGSYALGDQRVRCYMASVNQGLDWQTVLVEDPHVLGPMVQSPWSGRWLTVLQSRNYNVQSLPAITERPVGVYALRSKVGPGGVADEVVWVTDLALLDIRQPQPLRTRDRWLCTAQVWQDGRLCPVVLRSDDDGVTWAWRVLESVAPFTMQYPHRGVRWQQYSCEPTLVERGDGSLLLISRTSQDFHYQYESFDGGVTWTHPVPSACFHGTNTMPTLLRLQDGRILFFWCNTQPLPELDHRHQLGCDEAVQQGIWEDVFTNRDACHAAVSEDDGRTWRGFREIGLNSIRDRVDYRSYLSSSTNDKSVHQFEAMELPEGKVLLAYGQAPSSRRLVIFDPNWLEETERSEDFSEGLERLSTFMYVNSISGGGMPGKIGHCAWNRVPGPLLVPDPENALREVLHLVTPDDPRLFSPAQGAVWNFPASRQGEVVIKLHVSDGGLRLSLADRWFNPCDEYVGELAPWSVVLTPEMLSKDPFWSEIRLRWTMDRDQAVIQVENILPDPMPARFPLAPAGFSYLHLQTVARTRDYAGCLVSSLHFSACGKEAVIGASVRSGDL